MGFVGVVIPKKLKIGDLRRVYKKVCQSLTKRTANKSLSAIVLSSIFPQLIL